MDVGRIGARAGPVALALVGLAGAAVAQDYLCTGNACQFAEGKPLDSPRQDRKGSPLDRLAACDASLPASMHSRDPRTPHTNRWRSMYFKIFFEIIKASLCQTSAKLGP